MLSSVRDRVFEIAVTILTAFPFHIMLMAAAALWFCLVLLVLIDA
jgi:hypothetical protein